MTGRDASFAIAHSLLDDTLPWPAWTNLGCWQRPDGSALTRYPDAAEQLALRVGAAAITASNACVVDLGCGQGASLLLWRQHFAAARVIGMERQPDCVAAWQAQHPDTGLSLHRGRFDQLPLPEAIRHDLPATGADAVVCVDAAYHADSLDAFAAVARQLLHPQGRLAFTTVLRPARTSTAQRLQQRLQSRLAGIPAASFVSAAELQHTLTRQGFTDIRIDFLDQEVLPGFAAFVARRAAELTRPQRRSLAWLKIAGTAALCQHWHEQQAVRYVLVSAQRQERQLTNQTPIF